MDTQLNNDVQAHLEKINVKLYHMSWEKEFRNDILRIIVDQKKQRINMKRIIEISKYLTTYFAENKPTTKDYNLEVLSAGIERELLNENHWENSVGKLVSIVFKKTINNVKRIYGHVINYDKGKIKIKVNDENQKEYILTTKDIKSANWAFKEEENVR